jgi:hypothetical protein
MKSRNKNKKYNNKLQSLHKHHNLKQHLLEQLDQSKEYSQMVVAKHNGKNFVKYAIKEVN